MAIAKKIESSMSQASWIRKMFEEGMRMKKEFGEDQVYDFSLGNPILEPPEAFQRALRQVIEQAGIHRYMPNAGYPDCRAIVAEHLRQEIGAAVQGEDITMVCGAGGGLNVSLKALLDPGDEVLVIAPYFPEYRFYADNHGGSLVIAQSTEDFDLDLQEIDKALTARTKVVLINSPNNPTGRVYSASRLRELGELLEQKEGVFGHPITLLSDEPYRKIVYDGVKTAPVFAAHRNSIMITSHSKDLGLAGERIGYGVISPEHQDRLALRQAMTFTNRTLGFVNAPGLFQKAIAQSQDACVPISVYRELRDIFCQGLEEAGLQLERPQGAFYLFPRAPIDDDVAFVQLLLKQRILAVPGSGFGRKGHFRVCYCVTEREIRGSLPGFKQVVQEARSRKI